MSPCDAYAAASLVVARAGAMTLAELSAAGKPAILVPFPQAAEDHQTLNAKRHAASGAARVLPEAELTPERLAAWIRELSADPGRLRALAGGDVRYGGLYDLLGISRDYDSDRVMARFAVVRRERMVAW